MIRQATKYDKPQIIEMMKLFRSESGIEQYNNLDNEIYWDKLLDTILAGQGIIYISDNIGLIMAIILPTIWCDKTLYMQELAWYVKPEYRNTTHGYRLFRAYVDYAKKIKQEGRIKMFAIAKLHNSPYLNYEKHGFKKIDENWIQ